MNDTSEAPASGSTTTGPATFSDSSLSWSDAPSASAPSSESTPADSASADARVPPAADASDNGTAPAAGEPPKERWNDILANARTKAAEEALAPYSWAKQINQQEFSEIQRIASFFVKGDPIQGMQEMMAEIRKDPQHDAALRSMAARALAQRSQQAAPAATEPQPDLPIQLEDGRVVHLYSAEQQAKREAFLQEQWMQGVQKELQPLKQTHEQLQAQRAEIAKQHEVNTFTAQSMETAAKWKGMDDQSFRAKVADRLSRVPIQSDDPRDVSLALRDAYLEVRDAEDQTLTQKAQSKLLDNLQQKATASTSVNPGSAAPSSSRAVTSFHQLGPDAWR
jgi:hypothetical protein